MIHAEQAHHGGESPKEKEYLEGWQRSRAELVNFRKRVAEQQSAYSQQALKQVIEPLLSLADNLRTMLAHQPAELKDHPWVTGVAHIARQMDQVLAEYGVTLIGETGSEFDPTLHEAIEHVDSAEHPSGQVVAVVQAGYRLGDDVIRPARVKVSR
jgi:molecular chaperone GrpE